MLAVGKLPEAIVEGADGGDALLLEDVDDLVFMDVWNRSER